MTDHSAPLQGERTVFSDPAGMMAVGREIAQLTIAYRSDLVELSLGLQPPQRPSIELVETLTISYHRALLERVVIRPLSS